MPFESKIYSIDLCVRLEDASGNFLGVMKSVWNIQEIIDIVNGFGNNSMDSVMSEHTQHGSMEFKLVNREDKLIHSTERAGFEIFEDVNIENI